MKFLVLCLLFFLGVLASFVWRRTITKYQLIFAKEHFIEFAEQLSDLKKKLLKSKLKVSEESDSTNQNENQKDNLPDPQTGNRAGEPPVRPEPAQAEPDYFITSAGLAFLYSVRSEAEGEEQVHHVSLSYFGQPLAYAAATTFLAFAARLLRVPPERIAVSRSRQGIYHASFRLSAAEHAELLNRQVEIPPADTIKSIQLECNQVRDRIWPMSRIEQTAVQALETKEGS